MSDGYAVKATPSGENTYLEKQELEFVNDWSELEAAIQDLDNLDRLDGLTNPAGYSSIEVIQSYVPRLLTQYANLVELSFALTEGWEHYASLQGPTGLYLPDHR